MAENNIVITTDIAAPLSQYFSNHAPSKILVLADTNTYRYCYPLVKNLIPEHTVITIAPGEELKNIETCTFIWEEMTDLSLDRKSLLINLGGGVIGDMGGFAASAYKRGIEFMNLPTTLLAQADASVGGKLGIDFHGFKNHIGFFKDPENIFISPSFLQSLPQNELRSGFAEIIKHSLIGNKDHWDMLKKHTLQEQDMTQHINNAVKFKKEVVEKDPYEKGLRKILNFGHTIGHAIESYFLEKGANRLLHGEAIAVGMITEAYISSKQAGLSETALNEITKYLISIYGIVEIPEEAISTFIAMALQDKKNEGGKILMTLLPEIGRANINCEVGGNKIREAIEYYKEIRG